MKKYLVPAIGGALVLAAASFGYAQTPPGTDRPGGTPAEKSAHPDMDKNKGTKQVPAQGTTGSATNPTPPGTDRPRGAADEQSANPKMDTKK